jgi:DNA-binding MarR family transcriptional regulator
MLYVKRSAVGTKKSELLECIIRISKERLSRGQKSMILEILYSKEGMNSTRFIDSLCSKRSISKSAAWERLKVIKKAGLIEGGSMTSKGRELKLTGIGREVARVLYAEWCATYKL